MTRIKDWKVEDLTEEQKEIHDAIVSGPRGHVVGPLRIWLNNPGLASKKCSNSWRIRKIWNFIIKRII